MQQLDLGLGRDFKKAGRQRVEDHSEGWVSRMRAVAVRIAKEKSTVTVDDLRKYAVEHNDPPHHRNAWGAIFRGKQWTSIGFAPSKWASNHARINRVWALTDARGRHGSAT